MTLDKFAIRAAKAMPASRKMSAIEVEALDVHLRLRIGTAGTNAFAVAVAARRWSAPV
jgi:hypothetical protein